MLFRSGTWSSEQYAEQVGWLPVSNHSLRPGMFVAQVHGKSMEPKIADGSWCLFRPVTPGSREGRILLVQLQTENAESAGRFTVKRYHSEKRRTSAGWEHSAIELRPLNPQFSSIQLTPENIDGVVINAEFVAVVAA